MWAGTARASGGGHIYVGPAIAVRPQWGQQRRVGGWLVRTSVRACLRGSLPSLGASGRRNQP